VAGPETAITEQINQQGEVARGIIRQLGQVVLGQESVLRDVAVALVARGHVLLEGVPGTAKTLLVRTLSLTLGLEFRRIQFTPDLMPSDITGVNLLTGQGQFTFRAGPLFGDLILADEINRAPAKTQAALLEAMQERSVTVDGTSHQLSPSFTVFATQNPIEFEGTYPLPEAELDRFMMKILLDYPDAGTEQALLGRVLGGVEADDQRSYGVGRLLGEADLNAMRQAGKAVRVEPSVQQYITTLVRSTRGAPALTLGASPRASVALLKASQALAMIDGRPYTTPDDVKAMAPAVLRHRIAVAPELELEGVSADQALKTIIEKIEIPAGA
jgi:MoxR-like ATPase